MDNKKIMEICLYCPHFLQVCWTLSLPTDLPLDKDRILALEFMMDNEILVVGTRSGQLLSVLISSQSVEVVGNVEGGIIQMSSSPDGELLAIATGLGMLLFMTPEWDVLYEIPLVSSEVNTILCFYILTSR